MNPELFILRIPAILFALTIHEFAHGWVALRFGDTTAQDQGRLTLNPFAHLAFFGTAMLLFGPFGWAKPVPVNGYNFKEPKKGILFVSLAGPLSNIISAFLFGYLLRLMAHFQPSLMNSSISSFLYLSVMINLGISFFNLLPIPPLDGSKIVLGLLPDKWIPGYINKTRYFPIIFMVLLVAEWGFHIPIFSGIIQPVYHPYFNLFHLLIFGGTL